MSKIDPSLQSEALKHVRSILSQAFGHTGAQKALIVYDEAAPMTRMLAGVYREALPEAKSLNFDAAGPAAVFAAFDELGPGDLVVLIQSTSFRLDAFRIRIGLFARGMKVIEHPHLSRVQESEFATYIASLEYDRDYLQRVGLGLKERIDNTREVRLVHGADQLVYGGPMESAKLNIGDYTGMKNIGGQFPIGEVFTELKDLTRLNGTIPLFAFGDRNFAVYDCPDPIRVTIEKGRIVKVQNSVSAFDDVLNDIRQHEGEDVWVRELGFGMNRAMTRQTQIRNDVGMYERMCGIHMSLGGKHPTYPKEGFHKKKVKYHVDVFAAVDSVLISGEVVYRDGSYLL